jgi:hypothetical protein
MNYKYKGFQTTKHKSSMPAGLLKSKKVHPLSPRATSKVRRQEQTKKEVKDFKL